MWHFGQIEAPTKSIRKLRAQFHICFAGKLINKENDLDVDVKG